MPYFHNCTFGIYARNKSQVFIDSRNQFTSIPNTAIHAEADSFIKTTGLTSGATGSTVYINQANYGIVSIYSYFGMSRADFNRCMIGIFAKDRSFFQFDDCQMIGSGVTVAAGVVMDMNTVGSVYGIGITGYITATGSTQGATFRVVNDSILFVDSLTAAALGATSPYGTIRYDPYRGSNAGGFGTVGSGLDLPPGDLEP